MKFRTGDEIKKEIKRKYNRDPEKWQVLFGVDEDRYPTIIFHHTSGTWILKEFFLNPYNSIGCGVKTKPWKNLMENIPYSFGLRTLTPEEGEKILAGDIEVVEKVLSQSPLPFHECEGNLTIQGPILAPTKPIPFSTAQQKLDRKLRKELQSLVKRKHPELWKPYV